jgi:hypothetical protein
MDIYEDHVSYDTGKKVILCGASSYEELYYFNPAFDRLPDAVKEELRIMCVPFTVDVGGIFRLEYDREGNLLFAVESKEDDFFFDEIGSALKIKQLQQEKAELLAGLETFYRVFMAGEAMEDKYADRG